MNYSIRFRGFTLIEVLIALVILSVAFLGLAGLMVQTTKNTSFGGLMTEGATFAQDKLEELRASSWVAITPGSDLIHVVDDGSGGRKIEVQGWIPPKNLSSSKDFDRKWTVFANGNLHRNITITVNWNDKTMRSISLTSVIANPNPN